MESAESGDHHRRLFVAQLFYEMALDVWHDARVDLNEAAEGEEGLLFHLILVVAEEGYDLGEENIDHIGTGRLSYCVESSADCV